MRVITGTKDKVTFLSSLVLYGRVGRITVRWVEEHRSNWTKRRTVLTYQTRFR